MKGTNIGEFEELVLLTIASSKAAGAKDNFYTNPLPVTTPSGTAVESCADPSIIASRSR